MTAQTMWEAYRRTDPTTPDTYSAWAFGGDTDLLADLVLQGRKTATSSLLCLYTMAGEDLPQIGAYSVVLNSAGQAVCVIRTTRVYITRYCDVMMGHARREGEGDGSLSYWRQVHRDFFTEELRPHGMTFSQTMEVVCEDFELVYGG